MTTANIEFLIPDLLSNNGQNLTRPPATLPQFPLQLRYCGSIITRLIVRMHYIVEDYVWRNGVILHYPDMKIVRWFRLILKLDALLLP